MHVTSVVCLSIRLGFVLFDWAGGATHMPSWHFVVVCTSHASRLGLIVCSGCIASTRSSVRVGIMVRRRGIVVNRRNGWLAVLAVWSAIAIAGWSHGSVIGRAESTIAIMAIVMMLLFCNECASSDCAELSIMLLVFILVVLSLPKSLLPIARSIVV